MSEVGKALEGPERLIGSRVLDFDLKAVIGAGGMSVVYRGEHNGPFRYPSEEISAVEFVPVDIVERWVANKPEDFAPGFLESWRLFKAKSRSKRTGCL